MATISLMIINTGDIISVSDIDLTNVTNKELVMALRDNNLIPDYFNDATIIIYWDSGVQKNLCDGIQTLSELGMKDGDNVYIKASPTNN